MKLHFTEPAKSDLREISFWIARDNPRRAATFARELRVACRNILDFPKAHLIVGRYRAHEIRRKVHGNYLIFYIMTGVGVEILHILHGSRDIDEFLNPTG